MIRRPPLPPTELSQAPQMRAGTNVLMGRNPLGMWIQGPGGGGGFRHPFTVYASGSGVRVSQGLILASVSVEPLIGSVPISGDAKRPQPVLKLNPSATNRLGESWVCVEVTPDADGKIGAAEGEESEAKVEVVQRESPYVIEGPTGRAPLAQLVYREGRPPQVFQIAMFHYRYETSLAAGAGAKRKHFFL